MDTRLATQKLLTAVAQLQTGMESDDVLRPSTIGQCGGRLWARANGIQPETEREIKYSWHAFQGDLFESAIRQLLRLAGAEVLDPVEPHEREDRGLGPEERDPLTGFLPHGDGAILWPEAGIETWSLLECKYLRSMAMRGIILDGVQQAERMYLFQSVAYLKLAWLIAKNNGWDIPIPSQSVILAGSKDPSSVAMFLRQAVAQARYEEKPPEKLTEREAAQIERKKVWRPRLEGLYEPDVFYWETLSLADPVVQQTWELITGMPRAMKEDEPMFLHNPLLGDNEIDVECAAYCEVAAWCRDYHLQNGLEASIAAELAARGGS